MLPEAPDRARRRGNDRHDGPQRRELVGRPRQVAKDSKVRVAALDADYQFHKGLIDFQKNEIISKHYSLNAARLRLSRASSASR